MDVCTDVLQVVLLIVERKLKSIQSIVQRMAERIKSVTPVDSYSLPTPDEQPISLSTAYFQRQQLPLL